MNTTQPKKRLRKRKKSPFRWVKRIFFLLLITVLTAGYFLFGPQLMAASSVRPLCPGVWTMEYNGDYGMDDLIAQGGVASDIQLADFITRKLSHNLISLDSFLQAGGFGCSSLLGMSPQGTPLFGRNYDWFDCHTMIVKTKPKNGYASISTTCLDFLGDFRTTDSKQELYNRLLSLGAVWVPLDGMNEKGLMVADLLVEPGEAVSQSSGKLSMTTTSALRMLLDQAANVNEAVELLQNMDMVSSLGLSHHFAIADALGNSVVAEYVNGELTITPTDVVTNHYITENNPGYVGNTPSYLRQKLLQQHYDDTLFNGGMTKERLKQAMMEAASSNFAAFAESRPDSKTQWTMIYDPHNLSAEFYYQENFDEPLFFEVS